MDGPSTSWADPSQKARPTNRVTQCFVPQCPSTSLKFPNKLFLTVPKDPKVRANWLEAAGKLYVVSSSMHCCEDHFDMEEDVVDWHKYKQFGGPLRLKEGVVPHMFDCQQRVMVTRQQKRAPVRRAELEAPRFTSGGRKTELLHSTLQALLEAKAKPFSFDRIIEKQLASETVCLVPGVTESNDDDNKVKAEEDVDPMRPETFCKTCLAVDRRLYSLHDTPQYWDVCRDVDLSGSDAVCFECRARLAGFARFRRRVLRASAALAALPTQRDNGGWQAQTPPAVTCLSTLTLERISPSDAIVVDGDAVQVKEESLCDDDFVLTVEPLKACYDDQCFKTEERKTSKVVDSPESISDVFADQDGGQQDGGQQDGDGSETETASETGDNPIGEKQKSLLDMYRADFFVTSNLSRKEVLDYMETERMSTRYQFALHKCEPCASVFYSAQHLKAHTLLHDKKRGPAECDICHQRFKKTTHLKFHAPTHYNRFQCRSCDFVVFNYKKMYQHYLDLHDDTKRQCGVCRQTFTKYTEFRKHGRSAHRTSHSCAQCGRTFTNNVILQRHMLMAHTKVPDVECQFCHKKYKGEFNLKKHIVDAHVKNKHPDENAYCAECDMQFATIHRYRSHLRHAAKHATDQDPRFECDYCGKRCREKAALRTHIELKHMKLSRYKCDECEKIFPTVPYLKRHKREKHPTAPRTKRHVCHLCEKAFTVRKSLDEHMNTHLGLRPFVCKYCDATFSYSAALYNHNQLVHLKAKLGKKRNG